MYISFEEYKNYGGEKTGTEFLLLEELARAKLDNWTFNRITEVTPRIKLCMYIIITKSNVTDEKISSISHDGISITYKNDDIQEESLYEKIVELLPLSLTSRVVVQNENSNI